MVYSVVPKDDAERVIDNLVSLLEMAQDRKQPLKAILEAAAKTISRLFGVREVTVGLKNRAADIWAYEVVYGLPKDVEARILKVRYDRADMFSQEKFPNVKTGRLSELNPVEGMPTVETDQYGRPYRWGQPRRSLDEFHVGDFWDFWMYDSKREIIGWIEVSSPTSGKLLPRQDVRWIELFAAFCSSIVRIRRLEDDLKHP